MIKEGPKYDHEKDYLKNGGEILLPKALIGSLANCFVQVLSGERFSRPNQAQRAQLIKAGEGSMDFQLYSNEYGKLFGIIPWIRFCFPRISSFEQLRSGSMKMCDFMKQVIEKQMKTYEKSHVRNFIDIYIKEIQSGEIDDAKTGYFFDQLLMIGTDFIFPSLSAIETTVSFLFIHLLYREDILTKIQNEIDSVVGGGRLPKLDDRAK